MRRLLQRGLCLVMILGILAAMSPVFAADNADFSDVTVNKWYFVYVRACARAGLIKGVEAGRYAPEDPVTTEQLVTLVGRACFPDEAQAETTESDTWSSAYLRVAEELGVLENVDVSNLTAPIRRCDMAMILSNVSERVLGNTLEVKQFMELLPAGYDTGVYAEAIGKCYQAGLLNGYDGYFHGDEGVTRAQAAKIIALLAGLELQPLSREDAPSSGSNRLYILMYHSVAPDGAYCGPWTTNVSQLRADLQWMTDHGYTTVLPSELARGTALPDRAVLITFDDGYADNYVRAYPLLKEYGAKAVISPIVKRVEDRVDTFLTWDMCREMAESGLIEFGSHTYDRHSEGIARLEGETPEEYEERVISDIQTSVELMQQHLGTDVIFFAYPHGTTEAWASGYLRSAFRMTVTTRSTVADVSGGLYDLPRFNVSLREPASKYLPD